MEDDERDDRDNDEDDTDDNDDTAFRTPWAFRSPLGPWILLRFLSGRGEVTLAGQSHRDLSVRLGILLPPLRAREQLFSSRRLMTLAKHYFYRAALFSPASLFIRDFLPTTTCTRYERRVPRVISQG